MQLKGGRPTFSRDQSGRPTFSRDKSAPTAADPHLMHTKSGRPTSNIAPAANYAAKNFPPLKMPLSAADPPVLLSQLSKASIYASN